MKINLFFRLKENIVPIDYRKYIVSYIKQCLSAFDKELYHKWYEGNTEIKPFTFTVYFSNPKFQQENIFLESKNIKVYFKMPNSKDAIRLYNAFLLKFKEHKEFKITGNSMMLTNVYSEVIKEFEDTNLIIKMNSPLMARYHDKDKNENKYYLATDPKFEEIVKMNIANVIKGLNLDIDIVDFKIKPLKNSKAVIRLYDKMVEGSLGVFEIKGNKKLLNFLYQAGIGSCRSSGMGCFNIVK